MSGEQQQRERQAHAHVERLAEILQRDPWDPDAYTTEVEVMAGDRTLALVLLAWAEVLAPVAAPVAKIPDPATAFGDQYRHRDWPPMALEVLDAAARKGLTWNGVGSRISKLVLTLPDEELHELVWEWAKWHTSVMLAAGGMEHYRHCCAVHLQFADESMVDLVPTCGLITSTIAAGHLDVANRYLSDLVGTRTVPLGALANLWVTVASTLIQGTAVFAEVDFQGVPIALGTEVDTADRDHAAIALARDLIRAMQNGDRDTVEQLRPRIDQMSWEASAVMVWQLATTVGIRLRDHLGETRVRTTTGAVWVQMAHTSTLLRTGEWTPTELERRVARDVHAATRRPERTLRPHREEDLWSRLARIAAWAASVRLGLVALPATSALVALLEEARESAEVGEQWLHRLNGASMINGSAEVERWETAFLAESGGHLEELEILFSGPGGLPGLLYEIAADDIQG